MYHFSGQGPRHLRCYGARVMSLTNGFEFVFIALLKLFHSKLIKCIGCNKIVLAVIVNKDQADGDGHCRL